MAAENLSPVFHSVSSAYADGATIAADAATDSHKQGAAAIAIYLNGSLDIACAGIVIAKRISVNINLDTAETQGIEVAEELLAMADYIVQDGTVSVMRLQNIVAGLGMDDAAIDQLIEALESIQASRAVDV